MARNKYKRDDSDDEFDLTAMIDIVFLLIAFFMVVAKMIDDTKIDIAVPIADQSQISKDTPNRITVSVPANGEIWWGPEKLSNPEDVVDLVKAALNAKGDVLEVYLRADANAPHKYVRDAMKFIAEAGVYNVKFAAYEIK